MRADSLSVHPGDQRGEVNTVYGGVRFSMIGASASPPREAHSAVGGPAFVSVVCSLRGRAVRSLRRDRANRFGRARWSGGSATVAADGVRAHLRAIGPRHFVATVDHQFEEGHESFGIHHVEEVLAVTLLERLGGFVLHAAGIELGGGVVGFFGPSGAGKTTACALTDRPYYARDRMAIALMPDGEWWAWPLLGGTLPEGRLPADPTGAPLLGLLRVHHASPGTRETRLLPLAPHEATFTLRESVFTTDGSELDRLERVARAGTQVPVGRIWTTLSQNPLGPIGRWLAS